MSAAVLRYDDFQAGMVLGEAVEVCNPRMAQDWERIFGSARGDGAAEGASLALVLMMRAYMKVVAPRPPGNIHARQQVALTAVPQQGEAVRTVLSVADKELRRDRRYLRFAAEGTGAGGRPLYLASMTLVWAA